jgi:hypothetical protein
MRACRPYKYFNCYARLTRICFFYRVPMTLTLPLSTRAYRAACNRMEDTMALLNMMRIVLWSFFGVRRSASHETDMAAVKLPLLPVMAVMLALCFGGLLFTFAKIAVSVAH